MNSKIGCPVNMTSLQMSPFKQDKAEKVKVGGCQHVIGMQKKNAQKLHEGIEILAVTKETPKRPFYCFTFADRKFNPGSAVPYSVVIGFLCIPSQRPA